MSQTQKVDRRVRFWHARFWHGMTFGVFMRYLARHRFSIAPSRLWHLLTLVPVTLVNSAVGLVQRITLGRRIANTQLAAPPLFVIGHWRSGTTLLHELLMLDDQFITPLTVECMNPHHSVLTTGIIKALPFLVPSNRPMDDMKAGWMRPQEDEFALMNLGAVSPYEQVGFPNEDRRTGTLDLSGLSTKERAHWTGCLTWFFKMVTLRQGARRLVAKSPTHTARIRILREIFPQAQFILITREPRAVFGSTLKLWRSLSDGMALQSSDHDALEERVADEFEEVMTALERDVADLDDNHFHHVRYDALVSDPVGEMAKIYAALDLGSFGKMPDRIEAYFARRAEFRADQYALTDAQEQIVKTRMLPKMARWGYAAQKKDMAG